MTQFGLNAIRQKTNVVYLKPINKKMSICIWTVGRSTSRFTCYRRGHVTARITAPCVVPVRKQVKHEVAGGLDWVGDSCHSLCLSLQNGNNLNVLEALTNVCVQLLYITSILLLLFSLKLVTSRDENLTWGGSFLPNKKWSVVQTFFPPQGPRI